MLGESISLKIEQFSCAFLFISWLPHHVVEAWKMMFAKHIELNERNTLSQLMKKLRAHLSKEDFNSLNMFHRTFIMTFHFLPEIWNRILEDAELHIKYWKVYGDLYDPSAPEREPTTEELEILKTWRKHRFRLNLDVEDWFIHSHILMAKFAKFMRRLFQLISKEEPTATSFYKHRKFYLDNKKQNSITEAKYAKIIRKDTTWYIEELKDIRDDLIQHESVPKFWSYDISQNRIHLSRSRHGPKWVQTLYDLRDRYSTDFLEIKDERNFFKLLVFFEKNIGNIDEKYRGQIKNARKSYGARFPDIVTLFTKMSNFFCNVNDHFVSEIRKRFGYGRRIG